MFSSNRLKQKKSISPWHGAEWCFKQIELQWNKEQLQISSLQLEDKREWEPYRTWYIKPNQRYYGCTKKGKGNHRQHEISRRKKLHGVKSLNVQLTCLKTVADDQGPIDHNPLAHQHQIAWTSGKRKLECYAKHIWKPGHWKKFFWSSPIPGLMWMSDHFAQECSLMILPYEAELKLHPANSVEKNSHNQPTENTICSQIISEIDSA